MKKLVLSVTLLLVLSLSAFACGDDEEGGEEVDDAAPAQAASRSLPKTLVAIEGASEDAIDQVLSKNWTAVSKAEATMAKNWTDFKASSDGSKASADLRKAMDKALADLKTAVATKSELPARQAANDISKAVTDAFDLFPSKIPTDVGRLDYLERQVVIDADSGKWPAVETDLSQTMEVFQRVKPGLVAAGGAKQAASFEASLAKQKTLAATKDKAIITEANTALELVDAIETAY